MTDIVRSALIAALLDRQLPLLHALIDIGDEAAIRTAVAVWAHVDNAAILVSGDASYDQE